MKTKLSLLINKITGAIVLLSLCIACDSTDTSTKNRFLSAGIVWEEVRQQNTDINLDSVLEVLRPVLSPDSIEALENQIYVKYTASRYTLLPSETIDGELYWPIEYTVKHIYRWNSFSDESEREICGYLREDSQGSIYLRRGEQEILLYTFPPDGWEPGETIQYASWWGPVTEEIKPELLETITLKNGNSCQKYNKLLYGLTSTSGVFGLFDPPFDSLYRTDLVSYSRDGILLYKNENIKIPHQGG